MKHSFVLALMMAVILNPISFSYAKQDLNYHLITEIPIKGQGGWDALSVDSENHRLFVSHSDRVVVIDTEKNQVIKEITGTLGVHCIALAPDLKKAFSSDGKDGAVSVIDLDQLTVQTKIKVGLNPDAIVYMSKTQEVYAFNAKSNSVSVINAKSNAVITTIELPGKPEFATVDEKLSRVILNVEDKNEVAVIDGKTHKVTSTWKIEGCESPSGIAIDPLFERIFSVCENEKMVMIDAKTGKTIASAPTGAGTDGAAFDPKLKLAFSSNGKSATVSLVHEDTASKLSVLQAIKTQVGARTIALDPTTHRLYLTTADFAPAEAGKRPKPVDGTQRVLVYGL